MRYRISDEAFFSYTKRLSQHIHNTSSYLELVRLRPSVLALCRQYTSTSRRWALAITLQDYNIKLKYLGGALASPITLPAL